MPVIGILDHSQGIQSIMDMPSADRLPQARDTGATPLKEAGLEELYAPNNARQHVERLLCPEVGDGSILSPEAFSDLIAASLESLSSSDDMAVKGMLSEVRALQRNGELYQAYMGLMIGG